MARVAEDDDRAFTDLVRRFQGRVTNLIGLVIEATGLDAEIGNCRRGVRETRRRSRALRGETLVPTDPRRALAVGDLNGDQHLDIAVASPTGTVTTLLGTGWAGSRTSRTRRSAAFRSRSRAGISTATRSLDLRRRQPGDGASPSSSGTAREFPPSRTFRRFTSRASSRSATSTATTERLSSSRSNLAQGRRPRRRRTRRVRWAPGLPDRRALTETALGDVDGDGRLDVAVSGDRAAVILGDRAASFSTRRRTRSEAPRATSSSAIGTRTATSTSSYPASRSTASRCSSGTGTRVSRVAAIPDGGRSTYAAAGDLNDDGHLDLATVNYEEDDVRILLGDGQGRLRAASVPGRRRGERDRRRQSRRRRARRPCLCSTSGRRAVLLGDGHGNLGHPRLFRTGAEAIAPLSATSTGRILDLPLPREAVKSRLRGDGHGGFGSRGRVALDRRA
jgi:hypothetical protein